jgi:drug/metabolite transporter (DMT)-like permease
VSSSAQPPSVGILAGLTICALLAFAANSILCRQALGEHSIDAATFTAIRLVSGAITLLVISQFVSSREQRRAASRSWWPAVALFSYAAFFSLAYHWLTAGTGALLLFGFVQATMIGYSISRGTRLTLPQWLGIASAFAGLIILVWPGLSAPSPVGCTLMALAGISWGVYSLLGKGVADPLVATAVNFRRAVPLAFLLLIGFAFGNSPLHHSSRGFILAVISGAITSGLGYVIWYRALRGLTAVQAATVQLAVPILSALGGVALMSEPFPTRLAIAIPLVIGGIAYSTRKR